MKQIYFSIYIIGLLIYVFSLFYYCFNIVERRLTPETAYLERININVRGGRTKYNNFILADKEYYLSRTKAVFGSILSKKEISQFDVESINRERSEYEKLLYPNKELIQVSYFIDKEGDNKPYVPIGLRTGNENIKDSWYYFTLLGYTIKMALFLIFLGVISILGVKILLSGNNSGIVVFLCSLSLLIGLIAVISF